VLGTAVFHTLRREGIYSFAKKLLYLLRYLRELHFSKPRVSCERFPPAGEAMPTFSLLLPCWRSRHSWLCATIISVLKQSYPQWELLVGACELDKKAMNMLARFAAKDTRVKIIAIETNKGISANSNILAEKAGQEFIAFLDHDDLLHSGALDAVAQMIAAEKPDIVYTDEARISRQGMALMLPSRKPDWSPDSFLSINYICHLCVMKKALFLQIGGLRSAFDGAQDYDLLLRAHEKSEKIGHVPRVLYFWRSHPGSTAAEGSAKLYAAERRIAAVQESLDRRQMDACAQPGVAPGTVTVRYALRQKPSVDICMLSANKNNILAANLEKIISLTGYENFTVSILLNNQAHALSSGIFANPRIRQSVAHEAFNWSAMNNRLARESRADILLFLNDDIEVCDSDWLAALVEHAQRPEIGAAGGLLLYPSGRVQHSGLSLSPQCIAIDFHKGYKHSSFGYLMRLKTIQNVSAVTGACLATRRSVFMSAGGFDESLPLAFNDVDYCCTIYERNLRVVYTPHCVLIHHESYSRGYDTTQKNALRLRTEADYIRSKWGERLSNEHFLNTAAFS
jgi:GT2 family glycosyltransferase